jgi:hypothetical protein
MKTKLLYCYLLDHILSLLGVAVALFWSAGGVVIPRVEIKCASLQ